LKKFFFRVGPSPVDLAGLDPTGLTRSPAQKNTRVSFLTRACNHYYSSELYFTWTVKHNNERTNACNDKNKCNVKRNVWSLPGNWDRRRRWRWNCCAGSVVTGSGDDEDDQRWVFFSSGFSLLFWNDEAPVFSSSPSFPSLFFLLFSPVHPSLFFSSIPLCLVFIFHVFPPCSALLSSPSVFFLSPRLLSVFFCVFLSLLPPVSIVSPSVFFVRLSLPSSICLSSCVSSLSPLLSRFFSPPSSLVSFLHLPLVQYILWLL